MQILSPLGFELNERIQKYRVDNVTMFMCNKINLNSK